jgi:peptidoglycan/xylan/chitin deacetylase (PgdA/CDA1 family)
MNRSLALKRRAGRVLGVARRPFADRSRRVVLLYHAVGGEPWAVSASAFEAQMSWLSTHARVVSLPALLQRGRESSDALTCAITFDDGYESVHGRALPVLRSLGFPAVVYLTTAAIDEARNLSSDTFPGLYPGNRMLDWTQVDDLARAGIAIGSHLRRHVDLTRLEEAAAREELSGSKQDIERRLSRPCEDFSYPWGRHDRRARRWVEEAGFKTAAAGVHGSLTGRTDPIAIPRLDVRAEYELADFQAIVRGDWDFLGGWQTMKGLISG